MPDTINLKERLFKTPPKNSHYYIVAIDGRGGAGKTTLSKYLSNLLPDFAVLCGDEYFEPMNHPIAWGGYNEGRFYKDVIKPLRNAEPTIRFAAYDWQNQPHLKDQTININQGVIIDRCYSFNFDLNFDLKIWVETPREITLDRGIMRSAEPKEKAEKVWREVWKPLEDRYILQTNPDKIADIVLDGTRPFSDQL